MSLIFIGNSILLGIGLSMDAFSISMASGLSEPDMPRSRMGIIAGIFAVFQFLMPMAGWCCVHFILEIFSALSPYIPWVSLCLLTALGLLMIRDGLTGGEESAALRKGFIGLLVMAIATSIDALSVGFTIEKYTASDALTASAIIGIVTFAVCLAGIRLGKRFGMKLADKAVILGGGILIAVGLELALVG